MAQLAAQIYVVVVIVTSTASLVTESAVTIQGLKDRNWPGRLSTETVKRDHRSTALQDTYSWLDPSTEELKSLSDWHLIPHRRDHDDSWWMDFDAKRALVQLNPLDISILGHVTNQSFNTLNINTVVTYQKFLYADIEHNGSRGSQPI
ncbi:hypothetical protein PENSTE_c025G08478 [Penicillium steckii]|uniref:Uncharacterized protein n=1 Tax=Penicillium steckii TaxID=303698 RepID=A0A1V6SQD1_9EURO|nr:hypothetical protein PENSTE_c025G08478 [Penicillium steckii]